MQWQTPRHWLLWDGQRQAVGQAVAANACAVSLTGCNTMVSAGKDIERGGEKLQDASIKVRADWRSARDRNKSEYETGRKNCANMGEDQRDTCRDSAWLHSLLSYDRTSLG